MYIQRVTAQTIAVTGTGTTAETTITVPTTFTPAAGCIYDILISAQVPNGTIDAAVYKRSNGDYARCRGLGWRKVIRVQFFDDPEHFNLLMVRG